MENRQSDLGGFVPFKQLGPFMQLGPFRRRFKVRVRVRVRVRVGPCAQTLFSSEWAALPVSERPDKD